MGLDTVELVMAFEKAFGVEISDHAAANLISVRDVRDFVMTEHQRQGREVDASAILEKILDLTVQASNARRDKINLETRFVDDLGLD